MSRVCSVGGGSGRRLIAQGRNDPDAQFCETGAELRERRTNERKDYS